ncbi:PEP/pyruvate-binding domain-containing protein [Umezawaea endophytica]|uniref:PEP-utilizing enzyme n=1 Tax=Umezawaea endophytica TaxID=1654476 RepID=A0A9X3A774_9PSEU|nr:PEP/pyruvate-binding domain-containing protein [Umezawaea endophytica]MCS7484108.1 PEP-utilizing enzyme [Umezawaea endophytica]
MTSTLLRPLDTIGLADVGAVGRKSAVLGELRAAGLPVPEGYVLPAEVLDRLLASGRTDGLELPGDLIAELDALAHRLGGTAVAVRSSAVEEDLPGVSYAGQYETVLDVTGTGDLIAAVRTCWASAFSDRVATYQGTRALGAGRRIGVLIQHMVPAEAAGVAFSANPVTGDRNEVLVSAVRGLGDRLVSGLSTPDEWAVRDGVASLASGAERAITAEQAALVAELAKGIEVRFGSPQDIEWAIADGTLWLLQARPITALPEPRPEVPPGFWQRSNYATKPLSPMGRSTVFRCQTDAIDHLLTYSLGEKLEFREIGGWLYSTFVMAEGMERIAAKLATIMAGVRADEPATSCRQWHEKWRPTLSDELAAERASDPAALTDDELEAQLGHLLSLSAKATEVHFRLGGAGMLLLGQLGLACQELLGWEAARTMALLTGLPGSTTAPSHALGELVRLAERDTGVRKLLQTGGDAEACAEADPEFGAALRGYLREYGFRTVGMDITAPTMAENPALVISLVRGQLGRGFDPSRDADELTATREAAVAEATAALADRPEDLKRFDRVLENAQTAYPLRDDSILLSQTGFALIRRGVLDLGRRLAERGQLRDAQDVFMLELPKALSALRDGIGVDGLVSRRAAELALAQANPGPQSYGRPAQPSRPPGEWLGMLPPDVREVVAAGMWVWREAAGNLATSVNGSDDDAVISGIAASKGTYTGPARVILDETDWGELRPGDVLVCPQTTAEWSVLFPNVGALVTDHGGLLSHPAIIAREYRVPAVLATGDGTRRLRSGQLVTVDGSRGVVEIIDSPTAAKEQ